MEDRTILHKVSYLGHRSSWFAEEWHTRMVRVASRLSTGAVARDRWTGIALPWLPPRAWLLANRAQPAEGRKREAMPAAPVAEGLLAAATTRENISCETEDWWDYGKQVTRVVLS